MNKKILSLLLSFIMIFQFIMPASEITVYAETTENNISVSSNEIIHSGKSNNVEWSIDNNGHLKLWGSGNYFFDYDEYKTDWGQYASEIITAEVDIENITTLAYMFYGCSNLIDVDLSELDTAKVNGMDNMFQDCSSLRTVDLSNLNTSKVEWFTEMFYGCSNLSSLNLNNFNTSSAISMRNMFTGCESLSTIELSNFDTHNVMYMNGMFHGCTTLSTLDVSNFDTSNVENMSYMFGYCENLENIDVSGFNTSKTTDLSGMFAGCNRLTQLNISNFDTANANNMSNMFSDCSSLTSLDVRNFDTNNVQNMAYMFYGCMGLSNLNLSGFVLSKLESQESIEGFLDECVSLQKLHTPLDSSNSIKLPMNNGDVWIDEESNSYSHCPVSFNESILLTRIFSEYDEENNDETNTESNTHSTDVYASFVSGTKTSIIFTVDIEWTAMEFIYHESNEPVWNPETHTYSESADAYWEGTGTITVTNHSNTAIIAEGTYNALDRYGETALNFSNPFLHLESAEIGNEAKEGIIKVSPYGHLPAMTEKNQIGTITVTLSELSLSDDFDTLLDIIRFDLCPAMDDALDYIEYDLNNDQAIEVTDASTVPSGTAYYITSELDNLKDKAFEATMADTLDTIEDLKELYISAQNALHSAAKKIKG